MMLQSALAAARDTADTAADIALPLRALSTMFSLIFALAILYGLFLLFYFLLRKSYRALRRLEKLEKSVRKEPAERPGAAVKDAAEGGIAENAKASATLRDPGKPDGDRDRDGN